jgi:hypothetical protein
MSALKRNRHISLGALIFFFCVLSTLQGQVTPTPTPAPNPTPISGYDDNTNHQVNAGTGKSIVDDAAASSPPQLATTSEELDAIRMEVINFRRHVLLGFGVLFGAICWQQISKHI